MNQQDRCSHGMRAIKPSHSLCDQRCEQGSMYCSKHLREALERVAQLRDNYRVRRWPTALRA